MPFSPLAPDYRDRLAQQVPTGTVDPSLPTVTTPTSADPTASLLGSQRTQPSLAAVGESRYTSVSDIPEVKLGDFQSAGKSGNKGKDLVDGLSKVARGVPVPQVMGWDGKSTDVKGYMKAKLDRLSNFAMLAGLPLNERKALREQIRFQVQSGKTTDEKVALIDSLTSEQEQTLASSAIAGGTSTLPAAQDSMAVEYSPEQIAMLQASAASYMKPYTDDLTKRGMSDIAAAYMNQARTAPLISAAQERDQLAKQVQTLQNQLDSYSQGSTTSDADFGTMLAQLTGGG